MTKTTIEWTDVSWNPIRGCSLVSAGYANCYAMTQAHRFSGEDQPYGGLTELGPRGPCWAQASVELLCAVPDAGQRLAWALELAAACPFRLVANADLAAALLRQVVLVRRG